MWHTIHFSDVTCTLCYLKYLFWGILMLVSLPHTEASHTLNGQCHKLWCANTMLNKQRGEVTLCSLVSHVSWKAVAFGSFVPLFSWLTWDTERLLCWCLTTPTLACRALGTRLVQRNVLFDVINDHVCYWDHRANKCIKRLVNTLQFHWLGWGTVPYMWCHGGSNSNTLSWTA